MENSDENLKPVKSSATLGFTLSLIGLLSFFLLFVLSLSGAVFFNFDLLNMILFLMSFTGFLISIQELRGGRKNSLTIMSLIIGLIASLIWILFFLIF